MHVELTDEVFIRLDILVHLTRDVMVEVHVKVFAHPLELGTFVSIQKRLAVLLGDDHIHSAYVILNVNQVLEEQGALLSIESSSWVIRRGELYTTVPL
ncbi:hypothetical protein D9M70_209410 [compost metagenome]